MANRCACLLVSARSPSRHATKNADRKWNSDLLGGMTSSNMKTVAKPSHVVRGLLRLAVKQSQFSEFLLFFSRRYCIHSLSFMKALIKIATRLDSTTVCRPPGLAHFARVGEPVSVKTCIKCRLPSSLFFSDSRLLFNESLTARAL